MFIKQKRDFALNKIMDIIDIAVDYKYDDSISYHKILKLRYNHKSYTESLILNIKDNKVESVELERSGENIKIKYCSEIARKFNEIKEKSFEKVASIDDVKFKVIFPEYDLSEERNSIIEELLEKPESKDLKKKKWFNLW